MSPDATPLAAPQLDDPADIALRKTLDPQVAAAAAATATTATNASAQAAFGSFPPYLGMQHPAPRSSYASSQCDRPWSYPFADGSGTFRLTQCNWYLPTLNTPAIHRSDNDRHAARGLLRLLSGALAGLVPPAMLWEDDADAHSLLSLRWRPPP